MIKQSILGHECLGTVNNNQSQVMIEVTGSTGPADHLVMTNLVTKWPMPQPNNGKIVPGY